MLKKWFLCTAAVTVVCLLIFGCGGTSTNQTTNTATPTPTTSPTPATSATFDFAQYTGNKTFKLNTLPTTPYGPAWADIIVQKSNFLECKGASIALCYYSGPEGTTPCTIDGGNVANCTCYQIPAGQPYFVDINAILNMEVYLQTVEQCGKDGSKCKPTGTIEAPVCESINNNTLIPGAELISTFSTYLAKQIPINPTTCSTPAAYAGCMTAPCKQTGKTDPNTGLPLVQCGCPTYTGPYQVGTKINQDQCVLGSPYIWSAAYQVPNSQ
jgi:hypothetical protein